MTETQDREEFRVRADRVGVVEERFARLAKRAAKLGVDAPAYVVERQESVPVRWDERVDRWVQCSEADAERHELFFVVTVSGDEVALPGGWRLAGTIQHTDVGNAVRLTAAADEAGLDVTRYREVDPVCDHCRTARNRRDTYLVLSEDGELKQVGTNCLRDFFGHGNPEALVQFASLVSDLMGDLDDERDYFGGGGMRDRNVVNLQDFMAEVVAEIDAHGWLSKTAAAKTFSERSTAGEASSNMFARYSCSDAEGCTKGHDHRTIARPTDEQKMEADAVVTFARDYFEDRDIYSLNDYLNNLRVAMLRDWIEPRETGLAASAVMFVRREQEQELKRREFAKRNEASEWQGALKERLRNLRLQVRMVRDVEVDSWDGYGVERRTVVKMADADGNLYEFWTSKFFKAEAGEWLVVTGTVKKHDEYQGVKTTVLNRAVWDSAPDEAA